MRPNVSPSPLRKPVTRSTAWFWFGATWQRDAPQMVTVRSVILVVTILTVINVTCDCGYDLVHQKSPSADLCWYTSTAVSHKDLFWKASQDSLSSKLWAKQWYIFACVWLAILPGPLWVFSGYAGFLPCLKDVRLRLIVQSKLPLDVSVKDCLFVYVGLWWTGILSRVEPASHL